MNDRVRQLAVMRWLATTVLLVLIAIYLTTFSLHETDLILLVRAAAGAGIVGALADWFAVVALFRHPLGIPIPHTALLPKNQTRVAHSIGAFVSEHFFDPSVVSSAISESKLTAKIAQWAQANDIAGPFVASTSDALGTILRSQVGSGLRSDIVNLARRSALRASQSDVLATEIATLLKGAVKGEGLSRALIYVREAIESNGDTIERLVSDNSRWWIPSHVDKITASALVATVIAVLQELSKSDTKLRKSLEATLDEAIVEMEKNGTLSGIIQSATELYLNSAEFTDVIERAFAALQTNSDQDRKGGIAGHLETIVAAAIERIAKDPAIQTEADKMIAALSKRVVLEMRPSVSRFVAQTITSWNPDLLVARVENEVAKDLQFIRINGSILGAVIGGILFLCERALTG